MTGQKRDDRKKAPKQAQGAWTDLALHTLGWKSFQDLCAQVCEEILNLPVEIYREAQDGGQDATFVWRRMKKKETARNVTVQCKFTSKSDRSLKLGDLKQEEANIIALRAIDQAGTYMLMTNMGVAAPDAIAIKRRLRGLGVIHAHVFGREFLTRVIRASAKLRALVPRVYGLGDLSTILDERKAAQTRALLGHMLPTLRVYVPTTPHRDAVRSISQHGIVLLLGNPATGKSTIAAILATVAGENENSRCFKVESPDDLINHWNPNEAGGFYWIDDAFGPNQMREDFVDKWIAIMPKVQAAIAAKNTFVLTSRRHIYEAAKPKLGTKNHPLFRDNQAVVHVGKLIPNEKQQILYNHIKMGNQSTHWKGLIKPHLDALVNEPDFLPEIARRLGDKAYTHHLSCDRRSLIEFVREPKEHLVQTIRELSKLHRAALTLVFLHRGKMPVGAISPAMKELIVRHFGIDIESLGNAISELADSFLVQMTEGPNKVITFKHPTIGDALSAILGETDGMRSLYLRGVKPLTILTETICANMPEIEDAIVIDEDLEDLLLERLAEIPDDPSINRLLFSFLDERASDTAFRKAIELYPKILRRQAYPSHRTEYDPKVRSHARALRLGLLSESLRESTGNRLEAALFDHQDTSFLSDDGILALIPPTKVLRLSQRIRDEMLDRIPGLAEQVASEADLDIEPEDNFDDLKWAVRTMASLFENDDVAKELIDDAETAIANAIDDVKSRKDSVDEDPDYEWDWHQGALKREAPASIDDISSRSIFTDVDE